MEKEIHVLHTASAGMLLIIRRNTLGIDLFSKDPAGLYPDTPEWLREKLLERIEQREIETLLFTHGHGDHFCLEDVLEALRRNPQLMVISTEEVICRIRRREAVAGRLYGISPEKTDIVKIELPGCSLELFNSLHMGEQYAGVQNLACMLRMEDRKILIPGDAWPKPELFERVARWSQEIDLMAAPFPLIGIPTNRRILGKTLHLRNVLALHLPRPERDGQNWLENTKKVCVRAKDGLPAPVFGEELGKEYVF